MGEAGKTIYSIQLLRAIAALLVVLYHGQLAFSKHISQPAFALESYLFAFGAVGVHVFFVISGFIMVHSSRFDRRFDTRDFFRRRVIRIYPMYWVCAALYLLLHFLLGRPYQLGGIELAGAFALFPDHASAIIGPAWTLSFELFFYLCFGLAMKMGLTRGLVTLCVAFATAIVAGHFLALHEPVGRLVTNSLLLEFLAGAAIGWLLATGRLPRRGGRVLVILSLAFFAAGLWFGYDRLPSVIMWGIPSGLLIGGVIIWEKSDGLAGVLKRFSRLGDSSYVLYLIHLLVISVILLLAEHRPIIKSAEPALAAVAIAAVSLLVAEMLHTWLERPLLRWLNGLNRAHPPKPIAAQI